jgi:Domain of unknown function (DUF4917)
VVTEGSRQDKEARIARSAYLTYRHQRLARLNGALFIHGMAMSDNDQHILDAIADKSSRLKRSMSDSTAARLQRGISCARRHERLFALARRRVLDG